MEDRPLWAPWRIEYVTAPKDGECIFCTAAEASPGDPLVVQRGTHCFTMLNAFPYASGHVMVSPYRHVGELEELDEPEVAELMLLVRGAIGALRDVMRPAGFNVGLNLGRVAGAGFGDHLHMHVVPRWEGDTSFMPVIAGTRVISQALEDTAAALREALGTQDDAA
jgi:ATP adenylyltransferase